MVNARGEMNLNFFLPENSSLKFDRLDFIHVTPRPGLTGLDGPD
jgi:hypothetical protein